MANASAEKLKALGLRHGEKVVVGLAAALSFFLLFSAVTRPTIDLTPEQVDSDAKAADSNINRKQEPDDILKRLEEAGIKNPEFEKKVDEQAKNLLVASSFTPSHAWVYPQPGAGLIRDTPELIAPTELVAYPGRGGALVYELDPDSGNRIIDDTPKEEAPQAGRRGHRKKRGVEADAKKAEKEKKDLELQRQRLREKFAGVVGAPKQAEAEPEGPLKETTKGLRWVVITGVLDYKRLREDYVNALKRPEVAFPHFKRLDLERQALQPDGSWTDWEPLDLERNNQVLFNLPELDEELTPETVRFDSLVDPLPFLNAGRWQRVHVGSLVPEEKKAIAEKPANAGGAGGEGMMRQPEMIQPERTQQPLMAMPGGGGDAMDFQKSTEDTLMVRGLDFTVEPDRTYRFRSRIIVFNPNRGREDVSPGVDSKAAELIGPWSDSTEEVTMPADVTAYAMKKPLSADKRSEKITFQVTRWNPEDGVMVVKTFDAGPGEIVGENSGANYPVLDGSSKKPQYKRLDFTSHQVVLDAMGGEQVMPQIGAMGSRIDVPAVSLLIRPDGSVILKDQASDVTNQVRKDIDETYKRELEESSKKKDSPNSP